MLDNLSFGEAQSVAPKKMERKVETLPSFIARAYNATPMGEARTLPITLPEPPPSPNYDPKKVGTRLVSLLKKYAASTGTVAFKASFTLTEFALVLYWQKKPARPRKPPATDPPPMAKPAPREGKAEATLAEASRPTLLEELNSDGPSESALELLTGEGPDYPIQIQKKPRKGGDAR